MTEGIRSAPPQEIITDEQHAIYTEFGKACSMREGDPSAQFRVPSAAILTFQTGDEEGHSGYDYKARVWVDGYQPGEYPMAQLTQTPDKIVRYKYFESDKKMEEEHARNLSFQTRHKNPRPRDVVEEFGDPASTEVVRVFLKWFMEADKLQT